MNKNFNVGFITPIITEDNHIFGASGIDLPVINVGGDWSLYLPKQFESQLQKTFDDFGCTVAGTINALETLEKFLYNT